MECSVKLDLYAILQKGSVSTRRGKLINIGEHKNFSSVAGNSRLHNHQIH